MGVKVGCQTMKDTLVSVPKWSFKVERDLSVHTGRTQIKSSDDTTFRLRDLNLSQEAELGKGQMHVCQDGQICEERQN